MDKTQFDWELFWGACSAIFQVIALVVALLQWKEFTNYVRKHIRLVSARIFLFITILWIMGFGGYTIYLIIIQLQNGIPLNEIITFKNEVMKWDLITLLGFFIFTYTSMYLSGDIIIDKEGNIIKKKNQ